MQMAIVYICTGNYECFWDEFYSGSEKYFYPNVEKHYYVFTDSDRVIQYATNFNNVFTYFQRKAGWPYDTLMRFNIFCTIQDKLKEYDCCYFWNANTRFLRTINEEIIPFPNEEKELVLWRHTMCYDDEYGISFTPERNPISTAYIKEGELCHPYGGGFFGGTAKGFIKMSIALRDRITEDLQKGYIAVWHDQSHLEKYGTEVSCVEVPCNTIASEEYSLGRDVAAVFLNKEKYGGNGKLRGLSITQRIKTRLIKILVKLGHKTRLNSIIKKFLKKEGQTINDAKKKC